jgi:hypothetical protein
MIERGKDSGIFAPVFFKQAFEAERDNSKNSFFEDPLTHL